MSVDALLDTNILTALRDQEHSRHETVVQTVRAMRQERRVLIAPQSCYEFWVVATRPRSANGLGWSIEEVAGDLVVLRNTFIALPDPPDILDEWLSLCQVHAVSGKTAHDARLAAYARLHRIPTLVTLNARDFVRYGLDVVVP